MKKAEARSQKTVDGIGETVAVHQWPRILATES